MKRIALGAISGLLLVLPVWAVAQWSASDSYVPSDPTPTETVQKRITVQLDDGSGPRLCREIANTFQGDATFPSGFAYTIDFGGWRQNLLSACLTAHPDGTLEDGPAAGDGDSFTFTIATLTPPQGGAGQTSFSLPIGVYAPGKAKQELSSSFTVTAAVADTDPPTLANASGTATGTTTASLSVSTTGDPDGTLYYAATTSATPPADMTAEASQPVTAEGTQTVSVTGLTASTAYYAHFQHIDSDANASTVLTSASFTTDTPPAPSGSDILTVSASTASVNSWFSVPGTNLSATWDQTPAIMASHWHGTLVGGPCDGTVVPAPTGVNSRATDAAIYNALPDVDKASFVGGPWWGPADCAEIANISGDNYTYNDNSAAAVIDPWTDSYFVKSRNALYFNGGGHWTGGGGDSSVYKLDLSGEAAVWTRESDPAPALDPLGPGEDGDPCEHGSVYGSYHAGHEYGWGAAVPDIGGSANTNGHYMFDIGYFCSATDSARRAPEIMFFNDDVDASGNLRGWELIDTTGTPHETLMATLAYSKGMYAQYFPDLERVLVGGDTGSKQSYTWFNPVDRTWSALTTVPSSGFEYYGGQEAQTCMFPDENVFVRLDRDGNLFYATYTDGTDPVLTWGKGIDDTAKPAAGVSGHTSPLICDEVNNRLVTSSVADCDLWALDLSELTADGSTLATTANWTNISPGGIQGTTCPLTTQYAMDGFYHPETGSMYVKWHYNDTLWGFKLHAPQQAAAPAIGESHDFAAAPWTTLAASAMPLPTNAELPSWQVGTRTSDVIVNDRTGFAASPTSLLVPGQGGGAFYGGNRIYEFDFATLAWTVPVTYGGVSSDLGTEIYSDGSAPSAASGDGVVYVPTLGRVYRFGGSAFNGLVTDEVWEASASGWRHVATTPDLGDESRLKAAWNPTDEVVIVAGTTGIVDFDPATETFGSVSSITMAPHAMMAYDSTRDHLLFAQTNGFWNLIDNDPANRGSSLSFRTDADVPTNVGIAYHPTEDVFVIWGGGHQVGTIDPVTLALTNYPQNATGIAAPTIDTRPNGNVSVSGMWQYLPDQDLFVGLSDPNSPLWFYKLPAAPLTDHDKAALQADGFTCSDDIWTWFCGDLAASADTGTITKGVYNQVYQVGVGSPAIIDGQNSIFQSAGDSNKAAFVVDEPVTIRNVVCRNIESADNAGCFRMQNADLTIENVTVRDSMTMILTGFSGTNSLTVNNVDVSRVGGSPGEVGRSHGIYYGDNYGTMTVSNSTFTEPRYEGHHIKFGGETLLIENTTLDERNGFGSRAIDMIVGGHLTLRDVTIYMEADDGNPQAIGWAWEDFKPEKVRRTPAEQSLTFEGTVTIYCDPDGGSDFINGVHLDEITVTGTANIVWPNGECDPNNIVTP